MVKSLKLKCIISAKNNYKVLKYRKIEMKYYNGILFLVVNDRISSNSESIKPILCI